MATRFVIKNEQTALLSVKTCTPEPDVDSRREVNVGELCPRIKLYRDR